MYTVLKEIAASQRQQILFYCILQQVESSHKRHTCNKEGRNYKWKKNEKKKLFPYFICPSCIGKNIFSRKR